MKRFTIILFLPVIMMLHSSCNGLMDIEPENSMTYYNFFKTEQDFEGIMRGAYET